MNINNLYKINIFERYNDLKKSNKTEYDNNDLWKIFEYYSCIKLSEEYNKPFYEYDDIDPNFKEINKMSRNDTGIDCSDLLNTIVQCKLRKNSLIWKECSTFFGSQNIYSTEFKKAIVRWDNLIITRNSDCVLSENLFERNELFIDRPYCRKELLYFCENLINNPPLYPEDNTDFKLRDYQIEAINFIIENNKNIIINLPTGTGKNLVIINSFKENKKYLILVPRIILMDQLKNEIIKHKPKLKNKIQTIGDSNNKFDENNLITISVFNSIHLIENYCKNFEKIFIDEAHHINKPAIYYENDEDYLEDSKNNIIDSESINTKNILDDDESINTEDVDYTEEYFSDDESENISDDVEDELVNVKNYTKIIKSLEKYNNNVYLSATIDKTDNFEYYSQDIRAMIDIGYLCDYTIHVPIFNEDPNNKNICEYLLKNYRNVIIYCNSQKEGKHINTLMNELQLNSSEYIDCNTSKKKREIIIDKYKNGEIPFLVNVRILVEGFDAPISKGVCFMHLPSNKTTLIQIIGRALRLHSTKTIANIILPFSSNEDEKHICNFLKVMAKNDSRIKKSFENKHLGGYISIENCTEDDEESEFIEFKYNMVYNSMGILINSEELWINKLEDVKKYIDENGKRPSNDKDKKIKHLCKWLFHQQQNYKNKEFNMKNKIIYNLWTEFINDDKYKIYFQSNEEIWINNLEDVKKYIDENNKRPSTHDKNNCIKKIVNWLGKQQQNYKNKKNIMKNKIIYDNWVKFINDDKYKIYFFSNEELWINRLKNIKSYIDKNKKLPLLIDNDIQIKQLSRWILDQKHNYKSKKQIMKNEIFYNKWTEFINDDKYKIYFQSNEELWINKFEEVKFYFNNNKIPNSNDKNNIKQLETWILNQKNIYKRKKQIMKNEIFYNKWTEFINDDKYKKYFQSNEEFWFEILEKIKKYINENNKKPSNSDKDSEIKKLNKWMYKQVKNYKKKEQIMKNEIIYNKWSEFINDEKYKQYFKK